MVLLGLMVLALVIAAISKGCGDSDSGTPASQPGTSTTPTTTTGAVAALAVIEQINSQIQQTGVQFVTGKSELTAPSKATLDAVATTLQNNPDVRAEVQGHTDNEGDAAKNLQLSQARAEAVVAYLVAKGIKANRLTASGKGEAVPIADNTTEQGRAQNRRVEFAIAP